MINKVLKRWRGAVMGWNLKTPLIERIITETDGGVPLQSYREYQIAYQVHPWVHSCVRVISSNGASAELEVFKRRMFRQPNGQSLEIKEPMPAHVVTKLLRMPNAEMGLSRFDLINLTLGYLELSGNAYWMLVRAGAGGPAERIVPLRPDRVTPIPDRTNHYIIGYLYRMRGQEFRFQARDVVHLKYFNPYNDFMGQSTLAAARNTLNEDVLAQKYNENFLRNGARPGGAISFDHQLTKEDYDRLREQWKKAHGGAENAHKVAIFERGAKWESFGISQKDMDFIEGRKLSREQLSAVFGIPPVLINSYEHANYNTAKTQTQVFWRITMQPKQIMIAEAVGIQKAKFLGRSDALMDSEDWFLDWDNSHVWAVQEEMREGAETSVKEVTNGILNRNEVRARKYNLPPIDGGELYYRPSGQTQITEADAAPEPDDDENPPPPDDDEDDDGKIIVNGRTKADRVDLWRANQVITDPLERAFAKYYRAVLKDQEKEVLARLKEFDRRTMLDKRAPRDEPEVEAILFNLESARTHTEGTSKNLYERIMAEGGSRGVALAHLATRFDLDDPRAQAVLLKARQKFAQKVSETTWNTLKDSLVAGIKDGDGIASLASRVGHVMGTRASKSLEIARTETLRAFNAGILESWQQSPEGIEGKEWLATDDGHTRDSHLDLDGQVRALNGTFEVYEGAALSYPGDPAGDPSEIINCRCTLLPKMQEV